MFYDVDTKERAYRLYKNKNSMMKPTEYFISEQGDILKENQVCSKMQLEAI